jgi:hypothetical protein
VNDRIVEGGFDGFHAVPWVYLAVSRSRRSQASADEMSEKWEKERESDGESGETVEVERSRQRRLCKSDDEAVDS